jgi:hypothetical protein
MTDQAISTIIAAGVPTLAIVAAFVSNEFALSTMGKRMETLDRDLRDWAKTHHAARYLDWTFARQDRVA